MCRTDNCSTELQSHAPTAFRFLKQGLKHTVVAKDDFESRDNPFAYILNAGNTGQHYYTGYMGCWR